MFAQFLEFTNSRGVRRALAASNIQCQSFGYEGFDSEAGFDSGAGSTNSGFGYFQNPSPFGFSSVTVSNRDFGKALADYNQAFAEMLKKIRELLPLVKNQIFRFQIKYSL